MASARMMEFTFKLKENDVTTLLATLKTFKESIPTSDYAGTIGDIYEDIKGQQVEQMMQDLLAKQAKNFRDCSHDDQVDALRYISPKPKAARKRMSKGAWTTVAIGVGLSIFAWCWHEVTTPLPAAWQVEIDNNQCMELCVRHNLGGVFPDFQAATSECSQIIGKENSCILKVKP